MSKFVQIVDGDVRAAFGCQQNEAYWPGVVEVDDNDPRYLAFVESVSSVSPANPAVIERAWRDTQVGDTEWLVSRHRDEQEMLCIPTLAASQFSELLAYRQTLRDWPQSEYFPHGDYRPAAPSWLAEKFQ